MDNNIKIYNLDAEKYAAKFNQFSRVDDIDRLFSLIKIANARVLELGCANGRDAKEILKHTHNYIGVDGAENLLKIAKNEVKDGKFILNDFRKLNFKPNSFDIIIDFDSLFHLDKQELRKVLLNIYDWLSDDGLFLMDGKFGDYQKIVNPKQHDKEQYLYRSEDILRLSDNKFKMVYQEIVERFNKKWFTIILKKI